MLLDPDFRTWREYGNKGWPGRYLFDRAGKLAHVHYGEGEYEDTELAIGECLGVDVEPVEPLRPEDVPGALLEPQTADIVLPADRDRLELVRDWTDGEDWIAAADAGAAASFSSAPERPTRCSQAATSSRGSTRQMERSRRNRQDSASTACSSRPGP